MELAKVEQSYFDISYYEYIVSQLKNVNNLWIFTKIHLPNKKLEISVKHSFGYKLSCSEAIVLTDCKK
jgi:hypothetical protein